MSKCATRILLLGLTGALCAALSGCDVQLDEQMLNTPADFSIHISLPYATVTPPPAQKEEAQALVIDSEGSVIVNDSNSILQGEVSGAESSAGNYKSLRQGNTGLAVQALQTRLKELGYFTEGVSGVFDAETEAAVRRFEQTYGTMQTGVATAELQSRLFSADALVYGSEAYNSAVVSQYKVLQRGDVGSAVYSLQQRLKNLGYPIGELTGIYDNETANAVMLFYESYGLTASDVANVALQKELYSDSARTYGDADDAPASASSSMSVMNEDSVQEIQQRLIDLGYLSGSADGVLDRRTEIAARLFEEACGQLSSGAMGSDLLALLSSENAPTFDTSFARYANLIEGSSGESVSQLQARLVELGFAKGSPTGDYASATTASVKLFQGKNGLEETGVADVYTQAVLYSSFALNIDGETAISTVPAATAAPQAPVAGGAARLSVGSTGEDVLRLQHRLTELGFVSSVTGTFDNLTGRAVSAFQASIGRDPDGVATEALQAFLYSNAAPYNGTRFYDAVQPYRSLSSGDSGDDVTALQKRLWELGFLEKEDVRDSVGSFNEATARAVTALQESIGYESPDGIASAELQCYMYSESSSAFEGSE